MKKSLSAPSLHTLNTAQRTIPRPISTQALHTLVNDVNIANELEIVSHSTAYNVGMCLVQYGFPHNTLEVSPDLATCIATPSEDAKRIRAPQLPSDPFIPAQEEEEDNHRRGILLSRIRRAKKRKDQITPSAS